MEYDKSLEPERNLWALVLSSAIDDLACRSDGGLTQNRLARQGGSVRQKRRAAALEWIMANDTDVGSFQFTCDVLLLDPIAVQQRMLRADQQRLAKKLKPAPEEKKGCDSTTTTFNEHRAPAASPVMTGSIPSVTIADVMLQTNAPKQRPKQKGEHMSGNGKHNGIGHLEWLKDQLSQYEKQLAAAEAQVIRFKYLTINVRGALEALTGELQPMAATPLQPHNENGQNGAAKPKGAVLPALARRPPYDKVPIHQALAEILKVANKPIHHDELTRTIFAVDDGQDFERAKSSCTARLSKGAKKGRWHALGGGRWQIEKQGMSA